MDAAAPGQIDAVVTGTASQVLWDVLSTAYQRLGFHTLGDEAFRALVLARIVEPTSNLTSTGSCWS